MAPRLVLVFLQPKKRLSRAPVLRRAARASVHQEARKPGGGRGVVRSRGARRHQQRERGVTYPRAEENERPRDPT